MNISSEAPIGNEGKGHKLALGARGREFKSLRPDHFFLTRQLLVKFHRR